MTFSVKPPLLASLVLALCPLAAPAQTAPRHGATRRPCRVDRYYIITKASLSTPDIVDVSGASNLPPGAVLTVFIYNYIGQGSEIINTMATVSVGKDGLFDATVHAKRGMEFRTNMVCDVVFTAQDPSQPASVVAAVGRIGQHLYTASWNPQIQKDSGQRGAMLYDTTVVTD